MKVEEIQKLKYEQAYAALEQIVTRLESENQSLEDLLTLSEEGRLLADHCSSLLEQAQLRIQKLDPTNNPPRGG